MLWSDEHLMKAEFAIDDNMLPSSKVTEFNEAQRLKQDSPIVFTDAGMVMLRSSTHI